MTMRAKIKAGEFLGFVTAEPQDGDRTTPSASKPYLVPVETVRPEFNPVTHVLEGPVNEVTASQVTVRYSVRPKNAAEVQAMIDAKDAEIEREFERRWMAPIEFEVGGQVHTWHADLNAITNIQGVVLMITAGAPVPNPRPWTPLGSLTPVDITHAELIGLGAAIALRKDALFAIKKAKQAAVAAMTDPTAIYAFDPAAGWE